MKNSEVRLKETWIFRILQLPINKLKRNPALMKCLDSFVIYPFIQEHAHIPELARDFPQVQLLEYEYFLLLVLVFDHLIKNENVKIFSSKGVSNYDQI